MKAINVLICGAALTLNACALFAPATPGADSTVVSTELMATEALPLDPIRRTLEDFDRDRLLASTEIDHQIARLEALPARNALTQLRLVLLLSLRQNPADRTRALGLLETMPRTPPADAEALAPLTAWVSRELKDRATLEDKLDQLNQQLRDAQVRSDLLNSKIQELKAIEHSLVSRPNPEMGERSLTKP
ncbi:MAG: hypothetical protein KGK17_00190 [Betaproteobacteria bacterium]|nr:hypothetical protein [Betaproteobacteria bacterium]